MISAVAGPWATSTMPFWRSITIRAVFGSSVVRVTGSTSCRGSGRGGRGPRPDPGRPAGQRPRPRGCSLLPRSVGRLASAGFVRWSVMLQPGGEERGEEDVAGARRVDLPGTGWRRIPVRLRVPRRLASNSEPAGRPVGQDHPGRRTDDGVELGESRPRARGRRDSHRSGRRGRRPRTAGWRLARGPALRRRACAGDPASPGPGGRVRESPQPTRGRSHWRSGRPARLGGQPGARAASTTGSGSPGSTQVCTRPCSVSRFSKIGPG